MNDHTKPPKTCVICGADCSDAPRLKDDQGRYYHEICHRQSQEKKSDDLGNPNETTPTSNPSWRSLMHGIAVPKGVKVITKSDQLMLRIRWSEVFSWLWIVIVGFVFTLMVIVWYFSGHLDHPIGWLFTLAIYTALSYQLAQIFGNTTDFTINPNSIRVVTHPLATSFMRKEQLIITEDIGKINVMSSSESSADRSGYWIQCITKQNKKIKIYPNFETKQDIPEYIALICAKMLKFEKTYKHGRDESEGFSISFGNSDNDDVFLSYSRQHH